jgi:hypothetical protein
MKYDILGEHGGVCLAVGQLVVVSAMEKLIEANYKKMVRPKPQHLTK